MDEEFNMSMRKFLKQVGVTSQKAIEEAVRNAPAGSSGPHDVKVVLTIDELGLEHVVTGQIAGKS